MMTLAERQRLVDQFGPFPKCLDELYVFTALGLLGYHRYHAAPGGFLRLCLANDFVGAVLVADDSNILHLRDIATYIHEELPRGAWGSDERVDEWLKGGE